MDFERILGALGGLALVAVAGFQLHRWFAMRRGQAETLALLPPAGDVDAGLEARVREVTGYPFADPVRTSRGELAWRCRVDAAGRALAPEEEGPDTTTVWCVYRVEASPQVAGGVVNSLGLVIQSVGGRPLPKGLRVRPQGVPSRGNVKTGDPSFDGAVRVDAKPASARKAFAQRLIALEPAARAAIVRAVLEARWVTRDGELIRSDLRLEPGVVGPPLEAGVAAARALAGVVESE